jgi:hypothetical protein
MMASTTFNTYVVGLATGLLPVNETRDRVDPELLIL